MMHLRFLSAIMFAVITTVAVAQTQPSPNLTYSTTTNLLSPTVNAWTGTVQGQNAGFSGGTTPAFNPNTNTIIFGYTMATAAQTIAINQALSGTGIQVGGYNYSWNINNDPVTGQYGTLTGRVILRDAGGNALQTYNYNYPQRSGGFINFSGTQWFPQDYTLANLSNLELSFTGKDATFWAGYYGPQVRTPSLSLRYTVDPCAGNPRYSPSCPGYNNADMWSTGDLTSIYGTSFAINQALGFGNTGVRVHSATWGYDYTLGGQWCSGFSLLGICFQWSDSYVGGAVAITDINANVIASDSNHTSGQNITGSFRREILLGSTSPDISTLGGAAVSTYSGGITAVTPYLEFNFTPDICSSNPLASAQCPGYAAAYFTQQCTANPLYDQSCPGYAQAYFTQQCSANQLYNPSCPGYAAAYLTYQCNISQLYSPSCPGYQQAYLNQQCGISPLYSASCTNYQTALNQCTADPLSAAYCPGHQTAVTACSTNGLLYTYCPTYQSELNYCSTDPLFNNLCPTYQTATAQCSANPLTATYCPLYQTATIQCSANPLTAAYCPSYQTATTECAANPLYGAYCPGYQTATASCSANTLNHSYCPGYTTALNTCSSNPLSNTLCSGYTAASNACSANSLTYTYCPSYTTAIAACATNPQGNTMCPGYSSTASSGSGSSSSTTTASTTEPSVQVASDGKVSTEVAVVADSAVNSVITERATSTAPSPTATVSLAPQPAAATETVKAAALEQKKEDKKEDTKTADNNKDEKKEETKSADSKESSTTTAAASNEQKKDQPKTARQEIQERRVAAARAKAVEAGKELAGKMGEAASLEAQVAVQNVVIQAMGFTPGFDAYGKTILPDAQGYRPFEIYPGQRVIDNPQGRRFMTGSDRLHQEMVDQQYKRSE